MNNSNMLEPSFSSLVYKDWYCKKKTTKPFMLLQLDLFFANFWWLGAKRGYIAYGVLGGHASTVPKSIYNIGNEKKYRVIFAALAEFMTLCSKIKARGRKWI